MLFSTNKVHADKVLQIKKDDILFLLNLDSDILYGPFKARSDGRKDIVPEAWGGNYPYQVDVESIGERRKVLKATKMLSKMGINRQNVLNEKQTKLLLNYLVNPTEFDWGPLMTEVAFKRRKELSAGGLQTDDEKPRLEATTLWDYPRQSYGKTPKGDNKYAGVTPAFIIYNMVRRYTEPGDLVVDPMAGSGTTLDVCKEEGRRCKAYDISPTRPDIKQNDARKIPDLDDNTVDMIFIDSPYGDNIRYNEHPDDIGKISSEEERFYEELELVMQECHRMLKPGKVLGWLIGDQWVKGKFTPAGLKIYERLTKYFEPMDIVCVARRSQTSNTGIWYNRALRFNFYLRGFKYLFLMRKRSPEYSPRESQRINWSRYSRK
jgi:DNA modification methylase